MIKLTYTPETWDTPLGSLSDPSPMQEMTMTLTTEGMTWDEATREFHNFLRAAGFVIPYDIEWYEDGKDVDDDPLQKLTDWEEKYRPEECGVVKGFDQSKCIVKDCENHTDQGGFTGDLCNPCHAFITDGTGVYSQAYRNAQREWVYLTEQEMLHIVTRDGMQLAEAIEAKLKEKNT